MKSLGTDDANERIPLGRHIEGALKRTRTGATALLGGKSCTGPLQRTPYANHTCLRTLIRFRKELYMSRKKEHNNGNINRGDF